jgi:hypothetical protein
MIPIPFRRSAVFINKLTAIANMQARLDTIVGVEKYKADVEVRRGQDIDRVYRYIEASARGGAVRVFDWEWTTPKTVRTLIFTDDDITSYLRSNGFSYEYNCIEWHHATEKKELK